MSWGINAVGTPAAVKAAVAAEVNMPSGLKAAVAEFCDVAPDTYNNGVLVQSYGTHGNNGAFQLKFERVRLVSEPASDV